MKEKLNYIHRSSGVHHSGVSVSGLLRQYEKRPTKLNGFAKDDNGRPMAGTTVVEIFKKARFEGKKVLPMGTCPNWDYQNGCPGHFLVNILEDYEWEIGNG